MTARRAAALLLAAALLAPDAALAVRLRRPFDSAIGVNYGRDNNGGTGCADYRCGGYCYDGHSGTDFPLPLGTTVRAAAAGTVSATYNGCADYGGLGSTCGGRCGNYVRINHADGGSTLYCHMKLNSIAVHTGQAVSCGQVIGRSASSGNSTGPHLHLGFYLNGYTRDPFAGPCSQGTSYWMSQGTYPHPIPSTTCESTCACTPGATQTTSCGNCGHATRTCGSNCQWGGWSACTGQGACSPGQTQSRACCDCGSQQRSCSGSCQWSAWSACQGPDPGGGTQACATGEPGPCAEGRRRCVDGCLTCRRVYEPQPEICDDVDNDCSGAVDDGFPATLGSPPPAWAARRLDASSPQALAPGEHAEGWVIFENVGRESWPAGAVWLGALAPLSGAASRLYDPGSWPAHDVLAVVADEVRPGERAALRFTLRADDAAAGPISERFTLLDPRGEAMRCPAPDLQVALTGGRGVEAPAVDAGPAAAAAPLAGGCRVGPGRRGPAPPAWVLLLCLGALRARRRATPPRPGRAA